MKNKLTHGVELTSIEQMKFEKYISNNGIALNTLTVDKRKKLVEDWKNSNVTEIQTKQH